MKFLKCILCLMAMAIVFTTYANEKLDSIVEREFNSILISAINGNTQAQYIMGYRYYYGVVEHRDLTKAVAFLSQAAGNQHEAATELLKQALFDLDNKSIYHGSFEKADTTVIQSIYEYSKHREKTYKMVERPPKFPGGVNALSKYLATHLEYPETSRQRGVEGKVVLQFVVTKLGDIGDVRVLESVDENLDAEAVRVCKSLPNFVPGRVEGRPVNVWFTLPINFKLTD